ncbi:hypothetical protein FZEAL_8712 [Fusarium zealandicum]|uniref:Uncharacterized protein n=1 Tax=Fusarium zealandicum TaxID=1053134 RepID=A0A8H4UE94_9HYPO|nr:hypothetical protein FZEAL_8712 [Fusarium zealandicum]
MDIPNMVILMREQQRPVNASQTANGCTNPHGVSSSSYVMQGITFDKPQNKDDASLVEMFGKCSLDNTVSFPVTLSHDMDADMTDLQ